MSSSALDPASRDAAAVANLFWVMTAGAVVVWLAVMALAFHAARSKPTEREARSTRLLIGGCGVVLPTILLAGLLVYSLPLMPALRAGPDQPTILVSGEQWWWRVTYLDEQGEPLFESANEIRLALDQRVTLSLTSPDVIHSFWAPSLAGKVDLIPGRTTTLTLEPNRTGRFDGACAEFCGVSHALMDFTTVVMEEAEHARWLEAAAAPARSPVDGEAQRGLNLFLANGCGACHVVRGVAASGAVGPDLTHVAGRTSLAAGALANDAEAMRRWIARPETIKPGVHMPAFDMLPAEDLDAIVAYLGGLD